MNAAFYLFCFAKTWISKLSEKRQKTGQKDVAFWDIAAGDADAVKSSMKNEGWAFEMGCAPQHLSLPNTCRAPTLVVPNTCCSQRAPTELQRGPQAATAALLWRCMTVGASSGTTTRSG